MKTTTTPAVASSNSSDSEMHVLPEKGDTFLFGILGILALMLFMTGSWTGIRDILNERSLDFHSSPMIVLYIKGFAASCFQYGVLTTQPFRKNTLKKLWLTQNVINGGAVLILLAYLIGA